MTNTHAQSKKRHWRGGSGGAFRFVGARDPMAFLGKYRAGFARGDDSAVVSHPTVLSMDALLGTAAPGASGDCDMDTSEPLTPALPPPKPSLVHALPHELLEIVLSQLDGDSLLACALVCRTLTPLTYARDVWRNICMQRWPTLQTQFLPQLPGAPDYDLIRLYGGCWRRCFVEQHRKSVRAELCVEIPHFATLSTTRVEKIVSETFAIGEHRFCLWIFPNGNPNEPQYAGNVLSVYLVLTDLDARPPSWLTCAVFSLAVVNHVTPARRIEWHSCLIDNKFSAQLNNWGVHSLGALKALTNPTNGFLPSRDGALTITARVRLMSITFRVVRECDLKRHAHLGLVDFTSVATLTLPFCCTLQDLLTALQDAYGVAPEHARVWCFNQPVVSGQALRPRKLLTHAKVDRLTPMFGTLLCDGVDIDAYSFCQLYVESTSQDDAPLDALMSSMSMPAAAMLPLPGLHHMSLSPIVTKSPTSLATAAASSADAYVFVKALNPCTQQLEYVGRVRFSAQLSTRDIYECVATRLGCAAFELVMFKEEIAPTVFSGPIASSAAPVQPSSDSAPPGVLHPADIVIFTLHGAATQRTFASVMEQLLLARYAHAEGLLQSPTFAMPTLDAIETLAEQLDIPKFRVRSAFRKCREDGRRTLQYIMEGRHLGFICDSCGETDFKGPRYNCSMCTDYDLCHACNAQCHEVNHRYANVDGKWQRIYNFKDHRGSHTMREMMPVFYQYTSRFQLQQQQQQQQQQQSLNHRVHVPNGGHHLHTRCV